MVEVDDILVVQGETGKVCYKTTIDDKEYACIGFFNESTEGNTLEFKFFELKIENDKILTKEIKDRYILQKLTSNFAVEILEKTGMEEDFLKVFDN